MNAEVQRIFNEAQRQGQQTRDQGGIDIDLEERLLAPEVIERRRQHLVRMLRRGREARQQQREAVSSSDEERDLRRVEAQLHGMTAEFQAIFNQIFKRRDRAQNKDLEREREKSIRDNKSRCGCVVASRAPWRHQPCPCTC